MMPDLSSFSATWFDLMFRSTIQGAIFISVIWIVGLAFENRMSRKAQCWLWRLLFFKLILLLVIVRPLELPVLPAKSSAKNRAVSNEGSNLLGSLGLANNSLNRTIAEEKISRGGLAPVEEIAADSSFNSLQNRRMNMAIDNELPSQHWQAWSISNSTIVFSAWIFGILMCVGWLLFKWNSARRILCECHEIHDEAALGYCRELCKTFEINRLPKLATSSVIGSPALMGIFKPTIILPESTLKNLNTDQLKMVLAHELSHLKRWDLWWSWLPTLAQILFFFHPFVWVAHKRWLLSREMACDELVLSVTGQSAASYADALVYVSACMGRTDNGSMVGSTCMVQTSFSLKERIQAMKNFTPNQSTSIRTVFFLAFATLLIVIPWQLVERKASANGTPVKQRVSLEEMNLGFEQLNANARPKGWFGGGNGYELSTSLDAHSGEYCGQIASLEDDRNVVRFGTYTGKLDVTKFRGSRVRMSGYLKSDLDPKAWAGLWMRVDTENETAAFDNMSKRPVKGKTDWTQYSVVLDVPNEATNINFGFLISGVGVLWGDDLQFEIVGTLGEGPESTNMQRQAVSGDNNAHFLNLDFESHANGRPTNWGGGGKGYALTTSPDAHRGESCGKIKSIDDPDQLNFGTFTSRLDVNQYLGKQIRFSGYLKSDLEGQAWAGLWMRVDVKGKRPEFDNMNKRPVKGTTDWTQYSIVLDVPEEATNINFGFLMAGAGTLWGDDLQVTVLD
ncbi:MAG: M56 family metallopeptidase [Planctomycetota bacterium]